jgi:hypothetical protein
LRETAAKLAAPDAPADPLSGGNLAGTLPHALENLVKRQTGRKADLKQIELAAAGMMIVNVDEAGRHHAAVEIDQPGVVAPELLNGLPTAMILPSLIAIASAQPRRASTL